MNRVIVVADTDTKFIQQLRKTKSSDEIPLVSVSNGKDAQDIISDRKYQVVGIFLGLNIEKPTWAIVAKYAHIHRPATPIYLIQDDQVSWKELTQADLEKLGITSTVDKNTSYGDVLKLIEPMTINFNPSEALKIAKQNTDALGAESLAGDEAFIAIRANDFVSGAQSIFDVYAKTPLGRYLKLLHAGDNFTANRIESYLKKGLQFFYMRKEVQETYLEYCEHIASAMSDNKNIPLEFSSKQVMNQGEEVFQNVKLKGLNEKNMKYAEKAISNILKISSQVNKTKSSLLSSFMDDVALYNHGVGTMMLTGILSRHLEIDSDSAFQVVGTAAMFHDLALSNMPVECQTEDESKMNPKQLKLYREHPRLAAEELRKVRGTSEGAIQAIEQHHMRLNGKGFPTRTGTTMVSRVSEIVGICDEINLTMLACKKDPSLDVFKELEEKTFPYFARVIVNAAKETFFPDLQPN